jgi:hypothetical protein
MRGARVAAIVLVLLGVVFLLWHRPKPAPVAAKAHDQSADDQQAQSASSPGLGMGISFHAPDPAHPAPASSAEPDPPPVIDEIDLEKTEVCAGEENLVTVKSHTTNGTDQFLHAVIDGHQGSSVPVTMWTDMRGNVMGTHTVTVFGRGNVATTQPLPSYRVKDCRPTYIAEIMQRVRPNTWADFDFNARVVGVPRAPTQAEFERGAKAPPVPKPFKVVGYSWDFGDGSTEVSLTPVVEHSYEGRDQKTLFSYFVVGVTARGEKGEVATARLTLSLVNPAFEARASKNLVALMISLNPRFPVLGDDGKVTQNVRIWHAEPQPVTITHAAVVSYYKKAAGETKPQDVDVASLLGTTSIPPGKDGITTTVTLDTTMDSEVFSRTWAIDGTASDGARATGSFSVMVPPAKPTAENSDPVFDPMMKKKILLAEQILGKDTVDDDDLWRLEREGAFANLKSTPAEAAQARQQAIAAALAKGPPTENPAHVMPGPGTVPTSTGQQTAAPGQGTGGDRAAGNSP